MPAVHEGIIEALIAQPWLLASLHELTELDKSLKNETMPKEKIIRVSAWKRLLGASTVFSKGLALSQGLENLANYF